ncbi:MAG TPA: RagB/SusD family nutrient uptake outer membrane protein [Prolixibacteraceae bacterium]|nr:RagB/SusD family nutrient uptake outer membrane protein [Prolixibacteraceae bacterium]
MQFIMVALMVFGTGCNKDFFDKQPLDAISDGTFWETETDANLALTGCYRIVPQWGGEDFWTSRGLLFLDLAGGNGGEKERWPQGLTDGTLNSSYWVVSSYWNNSYKKIASCNNFLDHIGNVKMDEAKKAVMIGEARTLRAYEFFNLALYWGDVPLPKTTLKIEEANTISRSPKAEVWAFAEKELSESAAVLPAESAKGRITKGAALAILGRLQMAEKKWSDAAASYKKIIDLDVYIIDPAYEQLFWEVKEDSKEMILATQYQIDVFPNVNLQFLFPTMSGGWHQYSPYNNLVKVYECTDGKTIDESPLYDPNNPYENRDPRLDATIFIPGRTVFKGRTYDSRPGLGDPGDAFNAFNFSGYLIKKGCDANFSGNMMNSGVNVPIIRYSEVLLSYLESMLESGAAIDQALLDQTINKVRGRAEVHMPAVTETNKDKLRVILRRERRVELAFEGPRYFDILRWGIASDELTDVTFTGLKLTNDAANYTTYPVDADGYYKWEVKHFKKGINELWPIPLVEMQVNKNLTQNTGY